MRAADGAVEEVTITESGVSLQTIGGQAAKGLCGSGILSVLKELLRVGLLTSRGVFIKKEKLEETDYRWSMIRLNGDKREFLLSQNPELIVTQGDIRQVQLAKGAILSGFMALLKKANLTMDQLDKVLIAGQFGAHLPVESLVGTGILPMALRNRIEYVGNSSKTGAYMTLLSTKVKREMEVLAKQMDYMELAEVQDYDRIFADCMLFRDCIL